jgi:gliding motility-associated-like protein
MDSFLNSIYRVAFEKYQKLTQRLHRHHRKGTYAQLPAKEKRKFSHQIQKTERRLRYLQAQLGIAASAAVLLATNTEVQAQTLGPFVSNPPANPLPPPYQITRPKPAVVDIDNDGDLDIFVGDKYGNTRFFRNDGGVGSTRRFVEVFGAENPLDESNVGTGAAPAFVDVDNDGDYDVLIGNRSGYTFFFRNTGTASAPAFALETGASNPFDGIRGSFDPNGSEEASPTFIDFDNDGDKDLIVGSTYRDDLEFGTKDGVYYFENNNGTFTPVTNTPLTNAFSTSYNNALAFADVDTDGDLDVFLGRANYVWLFKNDGSSFNASTGPWDPEAHTGNPFHAVFFDANTTPALADFDNDGDLDMLVGSVNNYTMERDAPTPRYFENTGGFVMQRRTGMNLSPLDGVDVGQTASIQMVDLDGDGDLDATIGSKYSNPRTYFYINDAGRFIADNTRNWDASINGFNVNLNPAFVDIDADGDQDAFVGNIDDLTFLRNNNGVFETEYGPIAAYESGVTHDVSITFSDVDGDGDFDALMGGANNSWSPVLVYLENTGTETEPQFEVAPLPAPLNGLTFTNAPQLSSIDYDHDGDLDIIISDSYYSYEVAQIITDVRTFDNNGDNTLTETSLDFDQPLPGFTRITFSDIDDDGDLDMLAGMGEDLYGQEDGRVAYFENQNPPPVTSVNETTLEASLDQIVFVDNNLALDDSDNDNMVLATIAIEDFQSGQEELSFTPMGNVDGSFDGTTGILTLTGKDDVTTYQDVLRTVTYQFTGSSGGRSQAPLRTITFTVRDADFTNVSTASRTINVNLSNQAPVIIPQNLTVPSNNQVTLNLLSIISDPDGNLTPSASTIEIIQQPTSGAVASLEFESTSVVTLVIDYRSITFQGVDVLRLRATDDLGLQTEQDISITVDVVSDVVVYNAVSPNNDQLNEYLRIDGLTPDANAVKIYNRWGDEVFSVSNYDNDRSGKRFEGLNKNGNQLPAGNYFYKIENAGTTITGYLSLKR